MTTPRPTEGMEIRPATPDDLARIKAIAVAAEMFDTEEVAFFDDMLAGSLDGSLEGHSWLVGQIDSSGDSERVVAAAQFAPEPFADRMWNLYFIAVDPLHHGRGYGQVLMAFVEDLVRSKGETEARVLLVETSSTPQYDHTRDFYRQLGFDEEARIREYYGPGDDKVVFWKSLAVA